MAEKGGTKILAIITICVILVLIGLSGCIGDDGDNGKKNNNKIENEWYSGLKLTLEIDNESLNNGLNLTIKLININDTPITIDSYFHLSGGLLDIFLNGPNNTYLDISYSHSDHIRKNKILNPNDNLIVEISLKDFDIKYEYSTHDWRSWNWDTKGKYSIWVVYINELFSNLVEFEIK